MFPKVPKSSLARNPQVSPGFHLLPLDTPEVLCGQLTAETSQVGSVDWGVLYQRLGRRLGKENGERNMQTEEFIYTLL